MPPSRREFLAMGSAGVLAAAIPAGAQVPAAAINQKPDAPPGAPTAFGTAPPVGPEVSAATFAEAEKLVQVEMKAADREQAAGNWRMQMAPLYERRVGPRKFSPPSSIAPATLPGLCATTTLIGRRPRASWLAATSASPR